MWLTLLCSVIAHMQEVKSSLCEQILDVDLTMDKVLEELMDGDIIVFQRDDPDLDSYELPTAQDYFKYVSHLCFTRTSVATIFTIFSAT